MDFIQQLRVFLAVVDNGSFSRAAEALRMARPGVTNAVNALEDEIGARLLPRTTRRSTLTTEGDRFYDCATRFLAEILAAKKLFVATRPTPRWLLRLDVPVALARPLLPNRLPDLKQL